MDHPEALLTDLVLDIDAEFVAFGSRDGRQADAGVAARRLDDGIALVQQAAALRVLNHGVGDAVFDALVRVEIFELHDHFR